MPIITFSELFGVIARFIIAMSIMLAPFVIEAALDAWLANTLPPVEEMEVQP